MDGDTFLEEKVYRDLLTILGGYHVAVTVLSRAGLSLWSAAAEPVIYLKFDQVLQSQILVSVALWLFYFLSLSVQRHCTFFGSLCCGVALGAPECQVLSLASETKESLLLCTRNCSSVVRLS